MKTDDIIEVEIKGNNTQYAFNIQYVVNGSITVLHEENHTLHHQFQHVVDTDAQFRYCIINLATEGIELDVDYKVGSDVVDLTKVAKKDDIDVIDTTLNKMNKVLTDIKREKTFLLSKYDMISSSQGSITRNQMGLGLLSLGISLLVTVTAIQLIKRILRAKKSI